MSEKRDKREKRDGDRGRTTVRMVQIRGSLGQSIPRQHPSREPMPQLMFSPRPDRQSSWEQLNSPIPPVIPPRDPRRVPVAAAQPPTGTARHINPSGSSDTMIQPRQRVTVPMPSKMKSSNQLAGFVSPPTAAPVPMGLAPPMVAPIPQAASLAQATSLMPIAGFNGPAGVYLNPQQVAYFQQMGMQPPTFAPAFANMAAAVPTLPPVAVSIPDHTVPGASSGPATAPGLGPPGYVSEPSADERPRSSHRSSSGSTSRAKSAPATRAKMRHGPSSVDASTGQPKTPRFDCVPDEKRMPMDTTSFWKQFHHFTQNPEIESRSLGSNYPSTHKSPAMLYSAQYNPEMGPNDSQMSHAKKVFTTKAGSRRMYGVCLNPREHTDMPSNIKAILSVFPMVFFVDHPEQLDLAIQAANLNWGAYVSINFLYVQPDTIIHKKRKMYQWSDEWENLARVGGRPTRQYVDEYNKAAQEDRILKSLPTVLTVAPARQGHPIIIHLPLFYEVHRSEDPMNRGVVMEHLGFSQALVNFLRSLDKFKTLNCPEQAAAIYDAIRRPLYAELAKVTPDLHNFHASGLAPLCFKPWTDLGLMPQNGTYKLGHSEPEVKSVRNWQTYGRVDIQQSCGMQQEFMDIDYLNRTDTFWTTRHLIDLTHDPKTLQRVFMTACVTGMYHGIAAVTSELKKEQVRLFQSHGNMLRNQPEKNRSPDVLYPWDTMVNPRGIPTPGYCAQVLAEHPPHGSTSRNSKRRHSSGRSGNSVNSCNSEVEDINAPFLQSVHLFPTDQTTPNGTRVETRVQLSLSQLSPDQELANYRLLLKVSPTLGDTMKSSEEGHNPEPPKRRHKSRHRDQSRGFRRSQAPSPSSSQNWRPRRSSTPVLQKSHHSRSDAQKPKPMIQPPRPETSSSSSLSAVNEIRSDFVRHFVPAAVPDAKPQMSRLQEALANQHLDALHRWNEENPDKQLSLDRPHPRSSSSIKSTRTSTPATIRPSSVVKSELLEAEGPDSMAGSNGNHETSSQASTPHLVIATPAPNEGSLPSVTVPDSSTKPDSANDDDHDVRDFKREVEIKNGQFEMDQFGASVPGKGKVARRKQPRKTKDRVAGNASTRRYSLRSHAEVESHPDVSDDVVPGNNNASAAIEVISEVPDYSMWLCNNCSAANYFKCHQCGKSEVFPERPLSESLLHLSNFVVTDPSIVTNPSTEDEAVITVIQTKAIDEMITSIMAQVSSGQDMPSIE